jgi:hypothetical protein
LFDALSVSFAPAEYDARYGGARQRMADNFLAPTALWRDSANWTVVTPATRTIFARGLFTGTHYRETAEATWPPLPAALGESRHRISLTPLGGDGRFRWETRVEWNLGTAPAAGFERLAGLLALAATRSDGAAATWRAQLPRSSAALGRLFRIDSTRADRARDGTWLVTYAVRLVPDSAAREFPELARFVSRYIARSWFDLRLGDRRGARWMEAEARNLLLRVRVRVGPDGRLVPLLGPAGPLPDSLILTGDAFARGGFAGVGIRKIQGDFLLRRGHGRAGFSLRWNREPEWKFPFSVDRLISSALRAPFAGDGVAVDFGVEDGPGGRLLLVRALGGEFQESWLVRWMGALAGSVFGSWTGKVEPDANRFIAEAFAALRDDVRAAAGGGR